MMKSLVAGRLGGKNLAMREDYASTGRSKTDRLSMLGQLRAYIRKFYRYSDEESRIKAVNYIFMRLFQSATEKTNCREARWKCLAITTYVALVDYLYIDLRNNV